MAGVEKNGPVLDRMNIHSTFKARVIPEVDGVQVSFEWNGRHFGAPRKKTVESYELEWPTSATTPNDGEIR